MDILITYDIESEDGEDTNNVFKDAMKAKGYSDYFTHEKDGKTTTYYLPSTTLWRKNCTLKQAMKDVKQVEEDCGVNVERLYINKEADGDWRARPGKPYADE